MQIVYKDKDKAKAKAKDKMICKDIVTNHLFFVLMHATGDFQGILTHNNCFP
jgi:hypothetical protein